MQEDLRAHHAKATQQETRRRSETIDGDARKDLQRLKRLVDQLTSRRTLGDHARFGLYLQDYANGLLGAVREKAREIMEKGGVETHQDDGVRFQLQPRERGRKPMVHIHLGKEDT